MNINNSDGTSKPALEWFWVGFVIALCLGVSIVIFGTDWVKGNIESTLTTLFVGLLSVVIMGLLLFSFRKYIFNYLKLKGSVRLHDLLEPFSTYIEAISSGNRDKIIVAQNNLSLTFASWYSWISLRNFVVHSSIILLGALLGLGGVFLLKEQNGLIEKQNEYFQEQIKGQDRQWRVQQRATLLSMLYDKRDCQLKKDEDRECPNKASIRARKEAAIAFVVLEKDRIELIKKENAKLGIKQSILDDKPDLTKVDLSKAILNEVKWNNVKLFKANLNRATLVEAYLEYADISDAILNKADFSSTHMRSAFFNFSKMEKVNFVSADLRDVSFYHVSMQQANFINSDVRGADFTGADLQESIFFPSYFDGCKQLKLSKNWSKAYRIKELSCGESIPELPIDLKEIILKSK